MACCSPCPGRPWRAAFPMPMESFCGESAPGLDRTGRLSRPSLRTPRARPPCPPTLPLSRPTAPLLLSASAGMGFHYADVEEMGAWFLAVADGEAALARRAAQWMARRAWERRHEFAASLPKPDEAVRRAAQSGRVPVVLMDVGDNVGGGSPGDSRVLFDEVLRQGVENSLVILYDPAAVESCVRAGVRGAVRIGDLPGTVRTLSDGLYVETQVRHGGWKYNDQGVTAVVETPQRHTLVLTNRRIAPMSLGQILSLGVHPEGQRILSVQ